MQSDGQSLSDFYCTKHHLRGRLIGLATAFLKDAALLQQVGRIENAMRQSLDDLPRQIR